jgi:hypothetical protein
VSKHEKSRLFEKITDTKSDKKAKKGGLHKKNRQI